MFKHNFFLVWTIASASLTAFAAEPRAGSLGDLSIMALGPFLMEKDDGSSGADEIKRQAR